MIVKLREFLTQNKLTTILEPNKTYRLVGVRLEGKGPFIREEKTGAHIRAKRLQRVKAGDFVYSRLFAWRGAFGLIPADMDGAYVSNEFPNFEIDRNMVHPKFIELYFKQKRVWKEVEKSCIGTTKASRNRFKEKFLLDLEIPLPSLGQQKMVIEKIESLGRKIECTQELQEKSIAEAETILHSILRHILAQRVKYNWEEGPLSDFAEINPSRRGKTNYPISMPVTFVPMAAVDDITGRIVRPIVRPYAEVSKGYTWFKEGDVIFARITPCMQNGKAALAEGLENGIGFGSTEFHVLRPSVKIMGRWLHYLVRHKDLRDDAERYFKGTAGQQRVPQSFLQKKAIVVPPLDQQRCIVAFLDGLQAKTEELRNALAEAKCKIDELLPSILDGAFGGGRTNAFPKVF
jgi:type I restriction enzyme S subunit